MTGKSSVKAETIVLLVKDQTGFEMSVKMLNTVSVNYLMDSYAARAMRDRDHLRFFYDGEKLVESETPKQVCCAELFEFNPANDDILTLA